MLRFISGKRNLINDWKNNYHNLLKILTIPSETFVIDISRLIYNFKKCYE